MSDEYYDIIYHNIVSVVEQAKLAESLAAKFKLSDEKALLLLATDKPVPLKKKIDLKTALKYKSALNSIQLDCQIVNHEENDKKPFIEKRTGERRINTEDRRQHYRSSAVQPDRRQKDRRNSKT